MYLKEIEFAWAENIKSSYKKEGHTYKPSSVKVIIYLGIKLLLCSVPPLKTAEQAISFHHGVAPGRVYVAN